MLKFSYTVLALVVFTAPGFAEDQPDCQNGSQAELNMCAYNDFEKADKELNKLWPKVKKFAEETDAELEADQKGYAKALLASQRGWLAYRDGQCEVNGFQSRGGSMEPMLVSGCKATLTKKRVKELHDIIDVSQ
jgi:uncharacterized protein YecT (DUF1311 family)